MSEDAHAIEWGWKDHVRKHYLDEIRRQYEYTATTFRKVYYGEWEPDPSRPVFGKPKRRHGTPKELLSDL